MEALFLILIIAGFIGYIAYQDKQYKKTAYYQVTQNPYSSVKYDKGRHGEYLAYKRLQHFEETGGKFLFNVYIPKGNNETTEIDMLLICSKGLLVFESKNYSGWIFGNERNNNWTQTLPIGRGRSHKERFYNPIMQNATHIKHLRRIVSGNIPMRSIIVFSDECTLKDITINSDVRVMQIALPIENETHRSNALSNIAKNQIEAGLYDDAFQTALEITQTDKPAVGMAARFSDFKNSVLVKIACRYASEGDFEKADRVLINQSVLGGNLYP